MQIYQQYNQPDLAHGASQTVLHPAVAAAMVLTVLLMLWRPRKSSIAPLFFCIFLVPRGQELLLFGAHLYVREILVVVGFVYFTLKGFRIAGGWNTVDTLFVIWACYRFLAATITNWPGGTMYQLAILLQAMCGYFLFRYLFRSEMDILIAAKALAVLAAILGGFMLYEHLYRINLFGAYLGGVSAIPLIRNGAARAEASFAVSILAGSFGATLVPLFVWLWKKNRNLAITGLVGSTLMVYSTVSSTPLMAYIAALLGLSMWPLRRSMRSIRWGIALSIVALAIVMNAPVWFLISHVDVIGGSGGYDRAFLIDTCIRHFKDWWLIGTNKNGSWGFDMWDTSNQFVEEAERGGIVALSCFIGIIVKCFGRLGAMRKRVKREQQWLFWCLGSVMLAHIFAYFGVSYFDQTQIWWFAFLAMISAATAPLESAKLERITAPSAATTFPRLAARAASRDNQGAYWGWPEGR